MRKILFLSLMTLVGLHLDLGPRCHAEDLYVLSWANYLPDEVIADFEKATGAKVHVSTYESNEALHEKIKDASVSCDICIPSDYMVATLIEEERLQKLDRQRIPNVKHLDKQFLSLYFDPTNDFSIPFLWGTAGIGFNKQQVPSVDSWAVLFDPAHAGKVSMLDDARECFAVALRILGRPVNEVDASWLAKASDLLQEQKPRVAHYDSEGFVELLTSEQVAVAHGYSGELATLAAESPDKFSFVLPKEGGTMNVDNLCIPMKAANPAAAHAFIEFLSQPEVAARVVNASGYASANASARGHISPSILANKGIYPDAETLKKCEFIKELGASGDAVSESSTWVDEAWKRVRGR